LSHIRLTPAATDRALPGRNGAQKKPFERPNSLSNHASPARPLSSTVKSHFRNKILDEAKMKSSILLFFTVIIIPIVQAQSYTEIKEGGWGEGRDFVRPCFTDLDNDRLYDLILATGMDPWSI
jgi:hypothetical protein